MPEQSHYFVKNGNFGETYVPGVRRHTLRFHASLRMDVWEPFILTQEVSAQRSLMLCLYGTEGILFLEDPTSLGVMWEGHLKGTDRTGCISPNPRIRRR